MATYRKEFDTLEEAKLVAEGFRLIPNIDRIGFTPAEAEELLPAPNGKAAVTIDVKSDKLPEFAGFDAMGWVRVD